MISKLHFVVCLLIAVLVLCLASCGDDDPSTGSGQADSGDDDQINDDLDDDADDDASDDDLNDDADDDDTSEPGCQSGVFFNFDLSDGQRNIPYPSDLLKADDGKLDLNGQVVAYLDDILRYTPFFREALNTLDGFGLSTPIWFPATAAPDEQQLPDFTEPSASDAVFCLVVGDEANSHYGQYWPLDVEWVEKSGFISVRPHWPFAEKTIYACVATDRLSTASGDCYERPAHLRYILSEQAGDADPRAPDLETARLKSAPFVDDLIEQTGLSRNEIIGLSIFTTQSVTSDMLSIRDQLDDMAISDPPQVRDWQLVEAPGGDIDSIWQGRYDTIGWRRDGIFVRDENGDPVPGEPEEIPIRLSLPPPGAGEYEQPYPVVIFGHGNGSDLDESREIAEVLCPRGFAVAAINWAWHGERGRGLDDVLRMLLFFNVLSPRHFRDNIRQGVADTLWLKHVIRQLGDLDFSPQAGGGDGAPDLDTDHLLIFGQSLGGIHDGIVVTLEPDFDAGILYVPAADLRATGLESDTGAQIITILDLIEMLTPLNVKKDILVALDLLFAVLDPADPYAWGRYLLREPLFGQNSQTNILEMMAAYDDTIGAPGSAQMARGFGLTQLQPVVWAIDDLTLAGMPFSGPAVFQYDTDDHGFFEEYNDIGVASHRQAAHFFRSAVETGAATIIDGF